MIHAKNYETVSKFVKVMTKILWPIFSRTRCSDSCKYNKYNNLWQNLVIITNARVSLTGR